MTYISNDILIGFLKKYNVHKLVLSSGTRNIPFVSSVEVDKWFECFSVVDERNAAFFGMGLAQQSNEPVAIAYINHTIKFLNEFAISVLLAKFPNMPISPSPNNHMHKNPVFRSNLYDFEKHNIVKKSIITSLIFKVNPLPISITI